MGANLDTRDTRTIILGHKSLLLPTNIAGSKNKALMLSYLMELFNEGCIIIQSCIHSLLAFFFPPTVVLQGGRSVKLRKLISEGGFGYVYLVQDVRTGEMLALKKMLCQSDEQLEDAKREIFYHSEFSHINLLSLIDSAILKELKTAMPCITAYALFPYISRGSLREEIDRRLLPSHGAPQPFPEQLLWQIFSGILNGVNELHSHKPPLSHRDIKPENVLLRPDYTPVLIDFGSVRPGEVRINSRQDALRLQDEAASYSTIPYRAPELFDVQKESFVDTRTDVWSIGCLLYAMCFGYSPFECEIRDLTRPRVVECTYLRVLGGVNWPREHGYSLGIVDIVEYTLQQEGARRPHVQELLERVEDLNRTCVDGV